MGELLAHSQRTGFIQYFASLEVLASYSPTVNRQGLYSILPLKKYGGVTQPQSRDRVYTAFRLLESMGELLTQSTNRVYTAFHLLESMGELLNHRQRTGFIQHFTSKKVWVSYSPPVNRQGLHIILPPKKYG